MYSELIVNDKINYFKYFYNILFYSNIWGIIYSNLKNQNIISLHNLPENKILEAKTRIISSFQAIILIFLSIFHMYNIISYETWFSGILISPAFGIFDSIVVNLNYEKFKKGYNAIMLHHAILILAPLCINKVNSFVICRLYLFEFTVPILDCSWFLYYKKKENTLLFKVVSLSSFISFFIFRILNNLFIFKYFMIGNDTFSGLNYYITFTIGILFMSLNSYWFYSLIMMYIKKLK